tara:strand:- start:636 stop:1379 length:744 start_codon:yes stop_codon:yes gene_type:complete
MIGGTTQFSSNGGLNVEQTSNGAEVVSLSLSNQGTADNSAVIISHRGRDDASNQADYNYIKMVADDTGNGSEDGSIRLWTCSGGSMGERVRVQSGGGISFNGDSAAANALDDYEEGDLTWHLRKSDNTSGGSDNGSNVKYTKIGRMVHISGRIRTDSTSGNGQYVFHLDGALPFTPATSGTSVIGHLRSQDQEDSSLTASLAWVGSSTTVYIYAIDNDGDYAADHNNVGANTQTNLVITFSLTYQAS